MTAFVPMSCRSCGIEYQVPEHFYQGKREDKQWWYCPNGHQWHYAESEADRLRHERDRAIQEQARLADELRLAEAREKKLRKRISAGTCPCCKRTFANMATHMKRQHPDFVRAQGANVIPIKKTAGA